MKFFKKHKKETIFLMVGIAVFLILLIIFIVMWFSGSNNKYGTRLDKIDEVPLSDSYLGDIESDISDKSIVSKVSSNIQGKLVNFIITVKDGTSIDDAKKLSSVVKDGFTDDELNFYDLQVFVAVSSNKDDTKYPIIGYKHKNNDNFVWSNN